MSKNFIKKVKGGKVICHRCKEETARTTIDIGDEEVALCFFCFDSIKYGDRIFGKKEE